MNACTVAASSATSGGCAYIDGKTDHCLRRVLGLLPLRPDADPHALPWPSLHIPFMRSMALRTHLVSRATATLRMHSSVGTVGLGMGDVAVAAI
jgi:hypothetical protein